MNKYLYAFLFFLFRFFILIMMGTLVVQLFNSLLYELADKENPHPFSLLLSVRINRVVYSLFDKSNFVVSRRGLSYLMICEV